MTRFEMTALAYAVAYPEVTIADSAVIEAIAEETRVRYPPIGRGSTIWRWSHVVPSARIGANCVVGDHCYIAGVLGDGVKVQNGVSVYEGVVLGDLVFVGPYAVFTNDPHPRAWGAWDRVGTSVEHHASIGANATIRCGIVIGQYAMVACGSVVTKDVPPYALVYGNPSRFAGWICRRAHGRMRPTSDGHICAECGDGLVWSDEPDVVFAYVSAQGGEPERIPRHDPEPRRDALFGA
jgi:UDP-2-acetamido-3-amino-2,3-dideoxy-glucuronate N-acetyltransferase